MKIISLPFRFRTPDGAAVTPEAQQYVKGVSANL